MEHFRALSVEMRACIEDCLDCHAVCDEAVTLSLLLGDRHAEGNRVRLLMDCSAVCTANAGFMLRGSQYHTRTCELAAEICLACAGECERMPEGGATLARCAAVCRRCAESCRRMALALA